jgi:flagellar operon protein
MNPMDKLDFGPQTFPVRELNTIDKANPAKDKSIPDAEQFSNLLLDKLDDKLRFSQHAMKRMESRGIDLSSDDILKMQDAVKKAQEKGSRESLILSDKGAFVVSVKNNTIITAIDKGSLKENVFTNIDSTIMI